MLLLGYGLVSTLDPCVAVAVLAIVVVAVVVSQYAFCCGILEMASSLAVLLISMWLQPMFPLLLCLCVAAVVKVDRPLLVVRL